MQFSSRTTTEPSFAMVGSRTDTCPICKPRLSCLAGYGIVVIYVKATLVCCGLGIVIIYHVSEYFTKFLQWHSSFCSVGLDLANGIWFWAWTLCTQSDSMRPKVAFLWLSIVSLLQGSMDFLYTQWRGTLPRRLPVIALYSVICERVSTAYLAGLF